MNVSARHYGMDLVRALAIVTVLVAHSLMFFYSYFNIAPLIYFAIFGVELFFALSGFLIGKILLEMADQGLSPALVRVFWLKRWFRTIPAYLFIVVLTMALTGTFNWSQWLFLQNYFPQQMDNFPTSWSLTIEEWFYLLFPLTMLAVSRMPRVKLQPAAILAISALLFILVPWLARYQASLDATLAWDMGIRKQIPLRLDAIAYGVLLAVWHHRRAADLLKPKLNGLMGLMGLAGFAWCWWYFNSRIDIFSATASAANSTVFYPLITLACVGVIAFFLRFRHSPGSKFSKLVYLTSLTSYSLYLLHLQIFVYFAAKPESLAGSWGWFVVALVSMILAGAALYRLVERPFMNMRKRFDPRESVSPHFATQEAAKST